MSMLPGRPKTGETPRGGVARSAGVPTMSAPHSRSEGARSPRGGRRAAPGVHMSPSPGRPKMGETPHGGVARSAGVPTI